MKLSEPIWRLLWDYIANEDADEDYSAEMAERLCEIVLPQVWDEVAKMEAYADKLADGLPLLPKDIEVLQKANTDFAMANTQLESSLAEARQKAQDMEAMATDAMDRYSDAVDKYTDEIALIAKSLAEAREEIERLRERINLVLKILPTEETEAIAVLMAALEGGKKVYKDEHENS